MKKIKLESAPIIYKNHGQQAELVFRFTLTGKIEKADKRKATETTDCCGYSIKSARATIGRGATVEEALKHDSAERFAYVVKDFSVAYLMSREEYKAFCYDFSTLTTESPKNGKAYKRRFRYETAEMISVLENCSK